MKKTVFLMAMMSAVALVSVSCRNGGDDKNEKSTETQIPIEKKILGKWYAKSITIESGNPATTAGEPEVYINDECRKQTYWDFGGDGKSILSVHDYDSSEITGKCVEYPAVIYQYKIEGNKIEYKRPYGNPGEERKWFIYKGEVKEITDKSLVLDFKDDVNEDGAIDTITYTLYRK